MRLSHQATALPAPVGLTAAFDRAAASDYGTVIGREGRAINQDVLYAPMINQVTIPTAGRNFETLGEDPFLAGELVAPESNGVQGQGLIVTLKHLADERLRERAHATRRSSSTSARCTSSSCRRSRPACATAIPAR